MAGYLVVTGILFLLLGLRALLKPVEAVAVHYELNAEGIDAKNYLRSGAGGVTIACGAVILAGAFVPALTYAALIMPITVLGGLLFGRVVSVIMDGVPGPAAWVSGAFELMGLSFGVYWFVKTYA